MKEDREERLKVIILSILGIASLLIIYRVMMKWNEEVIAWCKKYNQKFKDMDREFLKENPFPSNNKRYIKLKSRDIDEV